MEPGEHHVCAMVQSSFVDSSVELAHLNAEAGKVYYFRTRLLLARGLEYLELTPVDADEGWNLVSSYRMSTSEAKK
jgi:predicted methyltransferase MtxX (methanogen marker protein 4)